MKIGIIKEEKIPQDFRVTFTPDHCLQLVENFDLDVAVQPSSIRCFDDASYVEKKLNLSNKLEDRDVLFGVKEVPIESLIPNKTYFFFSHTIKKQPYNKKLLQAVLEKNITLIDYECLKDKYNQRVVAFGRFAGIVGAYNGLLAYGKKYKSYNLKPANQCHDLEELWGELEKVKLHKGAKILLTGAGRVAKGSIEVLKKAGIKGVQENEYFVHHDEPVFIQLDSDAYNEKINNQDEDFDFQDFYTNPQEYESTFYRFLPVTDILIAGAFWDPKAPVLFTEEDVQSEDFKIKVIADITCDIQGSVPTTIRSTTIDDGYYDINRASFSEEPAYSDKENITVMAIDNLPCEVPRDASKSFGDQLLKAVIPELVKGDDSEMIKKATIAKNGKLTSYYSYLTDYVQD